jgi:hypothetical protein
MNKLFVILSSLILLACSANQIQFADHEYYMKAKVIHVDPKKSISKDVTKIDFMDLSAFVASNSFDKKVDHIKTHMIIFSKDGINKFIIVPLFESEEKMGCDKKKINQDEKDFCDAANSLQEYYDKVWILTPDDLKKPQYATRGHYMLLLQKKMLFTNPKVKAIYKYHGKDFVAYRKDFEPVETKNSITSEVVIFHKKIEPVSLIITSYIDNSDELFNQILSTIE